MKNKIFAKICVIILILALVLSFPQAVYAEETNLTEEILSEIRSRLDQALQAGEPWVDLADMNIIVNMYTEGFGTQYQKVLDLCDEAVEENGSFTLGSHKEPYVRFSPQVEPAEGSNEFGVGPNWLRSIGLYYDEYYRLADGNPDLEKIAAVQEQVTREYEEALSVVSEDMNDVEKALALYDYIIAVSNYPDVETMDENGIAAYDSESYNAISVFRDHISVCIANATAYCYLLSDCGIPCIQVDSNEMWHSWAMLYVDGAWYHADPTWDNERYEYGLTSLGDLNDDNWDLGAARHRYFLKSDEEMTDRLEHYGWFLTVDYTEDHSVDKTPVSGPSGRFDDTFFGDGNLWQEDVHYNYVNGSWYFLDRYTNQIVRTAYGEDMGEAEYLDAPSENTMKYVYSCGDCLFICESNGIWRYDTKDGKMEKLALLEEDPDRGSPVFTEMNVASGTLSGVAYYSYWSADPAAVSFSFPVEELLQREAVPGTEDPVVPETETEPEESVATETETKPEESAAAETETKPEEETAEPTKENPREETAEQTEGNSSEKPAGETSAPHGEAEAPQKDRSLIWVIVVLGVVAAAVTAGILVYRRRKK